MNATLPRLAALAAVLALAGLASAGELDPVVVTLRDRAAVASRLVAVADVADLAGGTAALREQMARLDLGELPLDGSGLRISRTQVAFRVRLADIPPSLCRVQGAEATLVSARYRTIKPDEVISAARKALLEILPWPPGEVQVELVQPVVAPLPRAAADELVVIKAETHSGHRGPGRVQMNVRIYVQSESRLSLPVYFDVRPCVKVAVCRRRIDKGEALSEANTYLELRPVDARSAQGLNPAGMAGKRAKQPLMPGHLVQSGDVEASDEGADAVSIKSQDAVRLQIRIGALKVTAAGQALQGGTKGQLIRVQNIDSNKVLLGRVIDRGLVEIE